MAKLRPSGGYRELRTFQIATIIYDATYWFCEKFLDPRSRTVDQMMQAARSGRQNIAEGSRAAATTSQTELRLVNVARSSFEELLLDYEDYLRHRRLPQWHPESADAMAVRQVPRNDPPDPSDPSDRTDRTDRTDQPKEGNPCSTPTPTLNAPSTSSTARLSPRLPEPPSACVLS